MRLMKFTPAFLSIGCAQRFAGWRMRLAAALLLGAFGRVEDDDLADVRVR